MGLVSPASTISEARSVTTSRVTTGAKVFVSAPRTLATAALGGLLLALSLPPWPGSTGTWPLGVVGAAVVFAAVDGRRLRARLGAGMAAGLGLYLPGLWWMRDFSLPGFLATVVLESAILAGATALVPGGARSRAGPGLRLAAFPAALVLAEAVRGVWPFGGLPLAGIELGQVAGPLAPAARLGGRLLVVGLVALAGAAAATAVRRRRPTDPPATARRRPLPSGAATRLVPALAAVAVVVAPSAGAVAPSGRSNGTLDGGRGAGRRPARVAGGRQRPDARASTPTWSASAGVGAGADVVLWPEDVVDVDGVFAGSPEEQALSALAAELRTTLVVGITEDVGDDRFRNASVAFGPDGRVVDRYDKVHRVPFGEYIPARSFFARLGDVSAVPRDAIAGTGPGVVDTPAGRFGVLISYEVFFQDRGRDAVRAGGRLLLVPTNASSYVDAQVPAQQLAVARLRALETGRWVVQAAPTGYSAVVDHQGHVLARSGLGGAAVLRHEVQLRTGRTVFVSLGPAPVLLARRRHPRPRPLAAQSRGRRVTVRPPAWLDFGAGREGAPVDDFSVHVRVSETQATVTVAGDLDVATAPVLREQLQALIAEGAQRLMVDLRRVTFIESVALGVIIAARKQLGSADKRLCVVLDPGQTYDPQGVQRHRARRGLPDPSHARSGRGGLRRRPVGRLGRPAQAGSGGLGGQVEVDHLEAEHPVLGHVGDDPPVAAARLPFDAQHGHVAVAAPPGRACRAPPGPCAPAAAAPPRPRPGHPRGRPPGSRWGCRTAARGRTRCRPSPAPPTTAAWRTPAAGSTAGAGRRPATTPRAGPAGRPAPRPSSPRSRRCRCGTWAGASHDAPRIRRRLTPAFYGAACF